MAQFVWCKNEERRIPTFRCLLCKERCKLVHDNPGIFDNRLETLLKSGKYRERFLMKRKASVVDREKPFLEDGANELPGSEKREGEQLDGRVFLLEEGKLKPFQQEEYTTSTLFQVTDSFLVESRLVRPEEPGNVVFEGKKPARKTQPVMIGKMGEATLFSSWDDLESNPAPLSEASEVIGVVPVRQIFVLKRK